MLISECAETNGSGKISPCGRFAALSKSLQLKLYELGNTLKLLTRWKVSDEVTSLEWSQDSELIICTQKKRGIIQVFNTENYSWTSTINPGILGISNSLISPDSRNILTFDNHCARLSIWNLSNAQTTNIKFPKYNKKGLSFTHDGKRMALITRDQDLDFLSFYNTEDWVLTKSFQSPISAGDLYYLPDSSAVVVWSQNFEYNFCVIQPNGTILNKFEGNLHVPGICRVEFNKSYMAVCGLDYKLRVFHLGSWVLFHEFCYKDNFEHRVLMLKESEEFRAEQVGSGEFEYIRENIGNYGETSFYVWAAGHYVSTVLKNAPNVVWVWDCKAAVLSVVIVMRKSVKSIVWADEYLVWVCGENSVYMWNNNSEVLVCSSGNIHLNKIEYKSGSFLLQNKLLAVYAKLN